MTYKPDPSDQPSRDKYAWLHEQQPVPTDLRRRRLRVPGWLRMVILLLLIGGVMGAVIFYGNSVSPKPSQPQPTAVVNSYQPPNVIPPVGQKVIIQGDSGTTLKMYSAPGTSSTFLAELPVGMMVTVTTGPREANGASWWRVRGDDGQGWVIGGKNGVSTGLTAASDDQLQQMIQDYSKAISPGTATASSYQGRALAYYNLQRYDEAIIDFTRALKLTPDDPLLYNLRGFAYTEQKSYQKAIADFTKAIQLDPKNAVYYANRGYAYVQQNDQNHALRDFNQAIALNPNFATFYNDRALLVSEDDAVADYNHALEIDPDYGFVYLNLAYITDHQQHYDRALEYCQHALLVDPAYAAPIYAQMGVIYSDKGDDTSALNYLNRSLSIEPDALTYQHRGSVYAHMGDDDDALADFKKAIDLDPTLADAYYNAGEVYYSRKDYQGAITYYTTAIELDPTMTDALVKRGASYRLLGDYADALTDLKEAVQLAPDDAAPYGELGNLYYDEGADAKALSYYDTYLKKSSHPDPEIVQRVQQLRNNSAPSRPTQTPSGPSV